VAFFWGLGNALMDDGWPLQDRVGFENIALKESCMKMVFPDDYNLVVQCSLGQRE
jgi:hypothetical protein